MNAQCHKRWFNCVKNTSQCNKDFIENCYITFQRFTIFAWKNENWKRLKIGTNLHDKKEYVIHIRNLKQAPNYELVHRKVHGVIKLNKKAWLKWYFNKTTELRKNAKNDFQKYFLRQMNNAVFRKTGICKKS